MSEKQEEYGAAEEAKRIKRIKPDRQRALDYFGSIEESLQPHNMKTGAMALIVDDVIYRIRNTLDAGKRDIKILCDPGGQNG